MVTTVIVAAMGFLSTILGVRLGAVWQRRNTHDQQILDAKIRGYGECASALTEFERVTYSRVRARLEDRPDAERETLRQEAYRHSSAARGAIGQLSVLSAGTEIPKGFEAVRQAISGLNEVETHDDLKDRHDRIYDYLDRVLDQARADLSR